MTEPKRYEFSVRQNWLGQLILRVHHSDNLPASGQWEDARPGHLPEFFSRILKEKPRG